jgi:hypothetical protein
MAHLQYREVTVVLSIPSDSQESANITAGFIVKSQLGHLRDDDTLLPIRASVLEKKR